VSNSKPKKPANSLTVMLTVCEGAPWEGEGPSVQEDYEGCLTKKELDQLVLLATRIGSAVVTIDIPSNVRRLLADAFAPEEKGLLAQAAELIKQHGPKTQKRGKVHAAGR
jgi:hypothetical protein